jgi:hypothetical protein
MAFIELLAHLLRALVRWGKRYERKSWSRCSDLCYIVRTYGERILMPSNSNRWIKPRRIGIHGHQTGLRLERIYGSKLNT